MSNQSGSAVGATPMPSEPVHEPAVRGPAPAPVLNAVRLMLVRAALGVVGVLVVFATKDTLKAEILKRNRSADAARLDSLLKGALISIVVVSIVFIVLYVLLAMKVRDGKNWARIATWVLAGIGILGSLTSLAQAAPAPSRVLTLVGGVIDVVIIVFLANGASSRYFSHQP